MVLKLVCVSLVCLAVGMAIGSTNPEFKLRGDRFKPLTYEQMTPEQKAMLGAQSESNLGHDYLRPMFRKGHAMALDDGAIVIRIAGIENLW